MDNCPICLQVLSDDNGICNTKCGHQFCTKCIADSIIKVNRKCPMCRTPITEEIQLYTQEQVDQAYYQGFQDYGEQSYMNGYDDSDRKWSKNYTKLQREKNQLDILYKMTVKQLQTTNTLNKIIPKIKRTLSE